MADKAPTKWANYGKFTGFQTLYDPVKIDDGANPSGQNTSVNEGDRISSRPYGYATFSTPIATPDDYGGQASVHSLHTFRKRNGENIMMRDIDTADFGAIVQFLDSETLEWQHLTYGALPQPYGYTDFNVNSDLASLVIFNNGHTNLQAWNGAHGNFASASNTAGFIGTIDQPNEPGTDLSVSQGYVAGDTVTIDGGTSTATILSVVNGAVVSFTMVNPGTLYSPGDPFLLGGPPAQLCKGEVDTVGGGGEILTFHITGRGVGYTVGGLYTDPSHVGVAAQFTVDAVYDGHVNTYPTAGDSIVVLNNTDSNTTGVKTTTNIIGTGTGLTIEILTLASNTITLSQTTSILNLGFLISNALVVGNPVTPLDPSATTQYTYTGAVGNTFFGVSPDPTVANHQVGASVFTQIATDPTPIATAARGSLLMTANNRLFVSGDPRNEQIVYFSEYGDPGNIGDTTLINIGTAEDPGIFNLAEGGGRVTGMVLQEGSIYFFKESIVYQATLSDSFYTLVPLKPFDQTSRSAGALFNTVFTGSNRVFMPTSDNQILALERIEYIDYPQLTPISYPIRPTILASDVRRLRGIVFNNKAFMALGSTNVSGDQAAVDPNAITFGTNNDRVLVWNTVTKQYDSPIVGWNVGCWTIYDDGTGDKLYFGSDVEPNVFQVISTPNDGEFPVNASWLSKRYDFGAPAQQKWCPNFFVYGRILPSTVLTVTVYFNEEGSTQTYTGSFSGTDTTKLFGLNESNAFGDNPFGVTVFGDQADSTGMRYFRIYFVNKVRAVPFYNVQIGFSSEGENQQWQVLDYGFDVGLYENPEQRTLYSAFEPA